MIELTNILVLHRDFQQYEIDLSFLWFFFFSVFPWICKIYITVYTYCWFVQRNLSQVYNEQCPLLNVCLQCLSRQIGMVFLDDIYKWDKSVESKSLSMFAVQFCRRFHVWLIPFLFTPQCTMVNIIKRIFIPNLSFLYFFSDVLNCLFENLECLIHLNVRRKVTNGVFLKEIVM